MADQIEIKLNKSHIPKHTHYTTLELSGQVKLADIIIQRKYRNADTKALRSYQIEPVASLNKIAVRAAIEATALFAKELRLSGVDVCYVSVAGFIRELQVSLLPRETVSLNSVLGHIGKGFIVIPDFTSLDNLVETYTLSDLRDLEQAMMAHLDMGGAFVFAGPRSVPKNTSVFGQVFLAAYDRHFTTLQVA
jgi:hypothetical protein